MSGIICKKCNRMFKKNSTLQYHTKNEVCQKAKKVYICTLCKETFNGNNGLKYHIANKVCINDNSIRIKCVNCGKTYASQSSLCTHKKKCNIVNFNNDTLDLNKIQQLEADIIRLKEIATMTNCNISNSHNNNNNTHNTTNNTINNNVTVLVKFGSENLGKLKLDDVQYALSKGFYAVNALVERVHFNPNLPENHNICFSNLKDKFGTIYDGEDWIIKYKSEILEQLIENKGAFIEEEIANNPHPTIRKNLKDAALRRMTVGPDNEDVIKAEDELKICIYNKRKYPQANLYKVIAH